MLSILSLGFLIGLRHALEADHIAAVTSLAARESSSKRIIAHGAVWGLGHALTLMAFAGVAILLDFSIRESLARWLEYGVGLMLMLLGGHLLYRLYKDRIHFHTHRHNDGKTHFHAHSHAGQSGEHSEVDHDHDHPRGLPVRTLLVGMMHGMAGSAALLVLSATTAASPTLGLLYVALFGIGSIIGMALLSTAIALPFVYTARFLTWGNRLLQGVVGLGTVTLGALLLT
jgi:high-affinity nickel permease